MEDGRANAVRLTSHKIGGILIELVCTKEHADDIMLSSTPTVYTNLFTLRQLSQSSVDFDYSTAEFIITRERNVVFANA
jgi:hypothetical protein